MIDELFQPMHLIIVLVMVLIIFGVSRRSDSDRAPGKQRDESTQSPSGDAESATTLRSADWAGTPSGEL